MRKEIQVAAGSAYYGTDVKRDDRDLAGGGRSWCGHGEVGEARRVGPFSYVEHPQVGARECGEETRAWGAGRGRRRGGRACRMWKAGARYISSASLFHDTLKLLWSENVSERFGAILLPISLVTHKSGTKANLTEAGATGDRVHDGIRHSAGNSAWKRCGIGAHLSLSQGLDDHLPLPDTHQQVVGARDSAPECAPKDENDTAASSVCSARAKRSAQWTRTTRGRKWKGRA
ncbi:hypothetical protein B0H13DRAFT_1851972 [Mycena leptocephala]|nr:hypothetical protein B0H13DRAFT_1851972 [Mycena leptocephala]